MKKIIISILSLSLFGLAQANEKTGDLKSSATMQATCIISTNPINFGVVATPLMSQTAQSDMNVLCSNASAYTVNLAYGGIYGQGSSNSEYSIAYAVKSSTYVGYNVFNSSSVNIGTFSCGFAGSGIGKVSFTNNQVAQIYGYSGVGTWNDTLKTCTSNNTLAGTYPTGWVGAYNAAGKQAVAGSGYAYGIMNGMSKGDKLAYSIAVPGDSTKVWNAGNNSYKATGIGTNQTIPMIAKIVPDKSGSKYPAPDMYLDTVTAVISY